MKGNMEVANGDGLHKRATTAPLDEKSPVTDTNVKIESKHDKDSDKEHPGGSAHGPLLQAARITGLFLYFMGSCAW